MLARSFLSAVDLGISEVERDALIATLFAFERGEIDNFTMRHFREECGTPACICGWANHFSEGRAFAEVSIMDNQAFSVRDILAGQAPKDAAVIVKGWVRTRRDSKAGISFVHLSDGSSFHPVQVVAPSTLPNYTDEVQKLTAGCAVEATGTIVPSPATGQPFEMQASAIKVIGWVDDPDTYPSQPKP